MVERRITPEADSSILSCSLHSFYLDSVKTGSFIFSKARGERNEDQKI